MTILEIIFISIGLAMDATAVTLAAAAAGFAVEKRQVFRLSFHFGLFQGLMPLFGWLLGATVVNYISRWDHWVAFILLGFIGTRMIIGGLDSNEEKIMTDPTRGWTLVTLSVATSIDALAVGLSLSVLDVGIWLPCILIAVITSLMAWVASRMGSLAGRKLGGRVEILGGLILLVIGARILFIHLTH